MDIEHPIENRVDTFPVQDPGPIDMLSLLDSSREARQRLKIWKTEGSDIEGCLVLYDPQVASPSGSRIPWPVLSLVDELHDCGWTSTQSVVHYKRDDSATSFDARAVRVDRKRHYLCVLALPSLFEQGACDFSSAEPDVFLSCC
eukprot:4585937-Pyramimonas_sp.AAC.1